MDAAALPDEVEELVRAQLQAGRFQSVDEVVVEALRLLLAREELFASYSHALRAQIAQGVAAEERGELHDGREAIAAVRAGISLLTVIAILGTAQDVTADELRIESFFPADEATERLFRQAHGGRA